MPGVLVRPSAAQACRQVGYLAATAATAARRSPGEMISAVLSAVAIVGSSGGNTVSGGPLRDMEIGWSLICAVYEASTGRLYEMDLSSFDAQSARDVSLAAMAVGVLGVLLVLKFVSSLVSKLLLIVVFGGIVWLGFTQRDSLSICIAEIQTRVEQGDSSDITCSFFGRDVTVEIPFNAPDR
jgi:hypothetical protein